MTPIEDPQGSMVETGHHVWHEVLDAFGPKVGVLICLVAVLTGIWLCKRNRQPKP